MNYRVLFYESATGKTPAEDFYDSLSTKERAKVARWITKLEEEGPNLPRPYVDTVRGKIRELRIRFGNLRYRFFYFFSGRDVVITHGIKKLSDKFPVREIARAENMRLDFLTRIEKGLIEK